MRNIDKKKLSYLAGGLFAVYLLYSVVDHLIAGVFYWTSLMVWGSFALMAIALFSGKYKLFAIGSALRIPQPALSVITGLQYLIYSPVVLLMDLLQIGAYVMLIMAVRKPERAAKYGKMAVGLLVATRLTAILFSMKNLAAVGITMGSVILYLLMDIALFYMPIILAGYVMQPVEQDILEFINTDAVKEIANLEAKLNTNAITQEEFEEKKNELLGL